MLRFGILYHCRFQIRDLGFGRSSLEDSDSGFGIRGINYKLRFSYEIRASGPPKLRFGFGIRPNLPNLTNLKLRES